ncbi:hypothetical protein [Hymenobacter ruricola]|uniref:Uncharacterized protein n=1 Tax=Hymenobacter ruricola TaxID=2791023 RepID=A0ABS0I7M8_9BACT|nr:hypothetical protein [Hymenobacter ruricola]MBF9222960.1 hypothetical protein [Hymenobacter ruricola]
MLKPVLVRRLFRRSGPAALLLVLCSAVWAVAASLLTFSAAYENTRVRVDWEVSTEADVTGFELARKSATDTGYSTVASVVPNGQRRYQYYDANVFRTVPGSTPGTPTPSAGGPFTYRLTVHGPNGDQSYLTVLAGTPSAVQRSWGTIKSMFR